MSAPIPVTPAETEALRERYHSALTPVYDFDKVCYAHNQGKLHLCPGGKPEHVFDTDAGLRFIVASYDVREVPVSEHDYLIHVSASPTREDYEAGGPTELVSGLGQAFARIRGVADDPLSYGSEDGGVLSFVFEPTDEELTVIRQWMLRPDTEVQPVL